MAAQSGIIIRVRSQLGMWRFPGVDPAMPVRTLMERIQQEKNVPVDHQALSKDPSGQEVLDPKLSFVTYGIMKSGDVIHLKIHEESDAIMAGHEVLTRKKVAADGSIVSVPYEDLNAGFRPGMPKLRDIKGAWTLTDFLEMDEQFVYKIKKDQGKNVSEMCTDANLPGDPLNNFVSYMQQTGWHQERVGYLYGEFTEEGGVKVDAIYEPPQINTAEGFEVQEDPREEQVEKLAQMLGMKRVGWIFAHPPREEGFIFSGEEVIFAALQQLEAADGMQKTPFVTIRCHCNEEGHGEFDAYQVTLQCMEMVAEGALDVNHEHRSTCAVSETFTAIVEAKAVKEVHNEMLLLNVPIKHNMEQRFHIQFPPANRLTSTQSTDVLRNTLASAPSLKDGIKDFHLLVFLMDFNGTFDWDHDMPRICQAAMEEDVPLNEGDSLLLQSVAGMMDG